MKKQVLVYGSIGGLLITVLKLAEYRFLVIEHSLEIYGGLVAGIFAALGIWLGRKLAGRRARKEAPVPVVQPVAADSRKREDVGITPRELEVLGLIAQGMSNREIAGKLYVSENTVKTHSSRIFEKLGAKRRTQAVQLGKELGIIP
jgi:DNA-binding CsgD family transcriptional regulator